MTHDDQVSTNDNRTRQNRDVKLQAIRNHTPKKCQVSTPFRMSESLCRENEQQRNDDADEDAGSRVPEYKPPEISLDDARHEDGINENKRLGKEIQEVKLSNLSDCQEDV